MMTTEQRDSQLPVGLHDIPVDQLWESPDNPRHITDEAMDRLEHALRADPRMMNARPVIALPTGEIIAGNMRHRCATQRLEWATVKTYVEDLSESERREWMLRDNSPYGEWVPDALAALLARHAADGGDLTLTGFADDEVDELLARAAADAEDNADGGGGRPPAPSLADRFGLPPFTVLDARSGIWRDRKREWQQVGIQSELGRDAPTRKGREVQDPQFYEKKRKLEERLGRELTTAEFHLLNEDAPDEGAGATGTSIFDPVLCELVYRWFSRVGHAVLDPFAGGSVRGIVASHLDRHYLGIDLSEEQIIANGGQAHSIGGDGTIRYLVGDATRLDQVIGDATAENIEAGIHPADDGAERFDLIFTCPPYYDLEQYGDDPGDLSSLDPDDFNAALATTVDQATGRLHDDRFSVWVVQDVRAGGGHRLHSLISAVVAAHEEAGVNLYNHAVLVQPVGSVRIRVGRQFVQSRKLGGVHQHVLVFCKGDPVAATRECGDIDADEIDQAVEAAKEDDPE